MNGPAALRAVAIANAAFVARVPAERNVCGILPQNIVLPAVRYWRVTGVDRNIPNPGVKRRTTQRVQAEIHANNEVEAFEVLELLRTAAADTVAPTVGTLTEVVIVTAGEGPPGTHPVTGASMETQDFKVSYNQVR